MSVRLQERPVELESRYELLEKIGTGSYATVFRARDRELGREVAIKQIHDEYLEDPKQLDRYWQEAQLLASLQHPNIVTIFDIYRDRGWLILELMQANLGQRMEGRQMDLRALRTTLAHCLRALKYLHSRGVVHGDIKPGNLMIDARKRVKIGDFGLARRVSDDEGSLLKGTTKYMAPEVVSDEFGEIGPASDLYSLGFAAYELMCGPNFETLFPGLGAFGRNKQVAWMMWHAAPDRKLPEIGRVLEGVPDDLRKVIQKLTEKDQSKRYKSADDALSDLNIDLKMVQKGGEGDDVSGLTQTTEIDAGKKKRTLIAAGALAVSLVTSLALVFWPSGTEAPIGSGAKTIAGLVRKVDADAGRIEIEDIEKRIPEEFSVAKTPRVYLLNSKKNILLRELQEGDRVEIERPAEGQAVSNITASRPVVSQGSIRSVNLQNGVILVAVEEGDQRDDVPIRVPEGTTVSINDEVKGLRDVKEGDSVGVKHFAEIGGKGARIAEKVMIRRLGETIGFISAVDVDKKRLTIRSGSGVSQLMSLPLADDCEITLGRGESASTLTLADLVREDRVRCLYDTKFRQINVTRATKKVSGTIAEVKPVDREIVVRTATGRMYDVRIDPAVEASREVTLERDAVTLADLRTFDNVEVTYDELPDGSATASSVYAVRPSQADRWIIAVAGDVYDEKFLTPLKHSTSDAEAVLRTMRTRYAATEDRTLLLRDERRDKLQQAITQRLKDARSETQVVIYVNCHAYVGKDGEVYLAGRDFHWDRMDETGLPLEWLVAALEDCPSEDKVLLLDCSRKGVGKDLESQPSTAEMVQKLRTPRKSTSIIASCSPGERGLMTQDGKQGVFSHCVADGFAGRADANLNLRVTAAELFAHLQKCMASTPAEQGGQQTPVLFAPK